MTTNFSTSANFGFKIPRYNTKLWHGAMRDNLFFIDTLLASVGLPSVAGIWQNSTPYVIGNRAFDAENSQIYECAVAHTSAATGTFSADRTANPTYWNAVSELTTWRGAWASSTGYNVRDVVVTDDGYYQCNTAHTSSADFATDSSNWDIVVDFSSSVDAAANSATAAATSATNSADSATASAASASASASSATASATSASNAASSATTATTQAGNASTSASNAATEAGNASTSASGAATSASNASTSATDAANSAAAAAASAAAARSLVVTKVATVSNITLSGTQTIDGVAVVANDLVLVRDQTADAENGVYVVAAGAWSRTTELDTWDEHVGALVSVQQGTLTANTLWHCTAQDGGTLNTTAIEFNRLFSAFRKTNGANVFEMFQVLDEFFGFESQNHINVVFNKKGANRVCRFTGTKDDLTRWAVDLGDATSESGGDDGSYFVIKAYDDSGSLVGNVMRMRRTDRQTFFSGPVALDTGQPLGFGGGAEIKSGSGAPEGAVSAIQGSLYMRTNGTMYRKASGGTGNTGWVTLS